MLNRLSGFQVVVIAVHLATLVIMGSLMAPGLVTRHVNLAFAFYAVLIPILVIGWTLARIDRKAQILGCWGLAILMSPLAALGIFGGWGILYIMDIMLLLFAAWQTNERPD